MLNREDVSMTEAEIIEIMVRAQEVDRKLPDTARPQTLKAMSLGYVHTTAEMNGWFAEDKHAANWSWLDPEKLRNSRNDIGLWEVAMELIKLVRKPENRRSLWAWASAKAGGMSVAKWARTVEHVHPETVSRRAKASITEIHHKLCSNSHLHNQNDMNEVLPDTPEISDKRDIITVWRPEESKPLACHFDTDIAGLQVADARNARRRELRARRQQAA